jgi:C-terminal processing protease CtpA/Prc
MKGFRLLLLFLLALPGLAQRYDPSRTFTPEQLRSDFTRLRQALEAGHPSLYWYITPDSLNAVFDATLARLDHPMTERAYRLALEPLFTQIRCGHTGVYASTGALRYRKQHRPHDFPLSVVERGGKLFVFSNLSTDSTVQRGQEIVRIDGQPAMDVYQQIRALVTSDGYNETYKTFVAATNFGGYYRYLHGEKAQYEVALTDSTGQVRTLRLTERREVRNRRKNAKPAPAARPPVPLPSPVLPTEAVLRRPPQPVGNRNIRLLFSERDSSVAVLDHNTFAEPNYRRIYRRIFRTLHERKTPNLVIDLRNNGGGRTASSQLLVAYLADSAFRMYRSTEACRQRRVFNRYLNERIPRWMALRVVARKSEQGTLALRSATKPKRPVRRYRYEGRVFVLTNGGSFSASSITAANLQAQGRATVVGRETGGGRNGCTAWIIPYLTLPETRVRVRFPLFRIETAVDAPNEGRGVLPDHEVHATLSDLLANRDTDLEKVYELVRQERSMARRE